MLPALKRARVGSSAAARNAEPLVPSDVGWQSTSNYKQAWTSCLDLLRHTQQSRSVNNAHTHTHPLNGPLFRDYRGEPVPER